MLTATFDIHRDNLKFLENLTQHTETSKQRTNKL